MGTGTITIAEESLRTLIKESLIEVLKERKDLLEDAVVEAIEDIGLAGAITKGLKTPSVSESDISKALDDVK